MLRSIRAAGRRLVPTLFAVFACLSTSTTFHHVASADDGDTLKVVRVKIAKWIGKQENARTICDARLTMRPGKESQIQFKGNGTTAPATTLHMSLDTKHDAQQVLHVVACRIVETTADGKEHVLAAPKLALTEGSDGKISIGSDPGDGLEVTLLVGAKK